jgi:hypothetical protein
MHLSKFVTKRLNIGDMGHQNLQMFFTLTDREAILNITLCTRRQGDFWASHHEWTRILLEHLQGTPYILFKW